MAAPGLPRPRTPKAGRRRGRFTQHHTLANIKTLLEHQPLGLSLADLAAGARISERSVRRYLDELKRTIEIDWVPTTAGGPRLWRIKPSERGRSMTLRRAQAYALYASRAIFEVFKGSALYDDVALALRAVLDLALRPGRAALQGDLPFDQALERRFLFLADPPHDYRARSEDLDTLLHAVADVRPVGLRLKVRGEPRERPIDVYPLALLVHRGEVSLVCRDVASGAVSVVPFDAVTDVNTLQSDRFTLPQDFDAAAFFHGDQGVALPTRVKAVVDFDARVADAVRARKVHPAQKLALSPDGRVRVSLPLANRSALVAWILGFGDAARVVEPPDLAEEVASTLRRAVARYERSN